MGLLLAGLAAAFIGTFAGTLNAAQAYILNDIYVKYINKQASQRKITGVGYLVGIMVVAVSVTMGFFAGNVNDILQWIVGALYGGYIAANVLKWHWWRFNAYGFFWGNWPGFRPVTLLAIIGALIAMRSRRGWIIGGLIQLYLIPYTLSAPHYYRYRASIEPLMYVLAGVPVGLCLDLMLNRVKSRKWWPRPATA